jgi:hypothetical protein
MRRIGSLLIGVWLLSQALAVKAPFAGRAEL